MKSCALRAAAHRGDLETGGIRQAHRGAFRVCGVLEGVYGADMEGKRSSKIDVIRYAMRERGITPSSAVMVGDRKYDITGAREAGLADIGVLYGYGSREELVEAGATRLAASVADLREMLTSSDG